MRSAFACMRPAAILFASICTHSTLWERRGGCQDAVQPCMYNDWLVTAPLPRAICLACPVLTSVACCISSAALLTLLHGEAVCVCLRFPAANLQAVHVAVQVINEQGYPRQAESTRLRPPQPLELSPSEQQVLLHHKAHAEAWGWQFAESECGSACKPVLTHAAAVLGIPLNVTELQVSGIASFVKIVHDI